MNSQKYLKDTINIRSSNLSLIRFVSAILVIACHAYPLAGGRTNIDPLLQISSGTISFGSLAVAVFFISSGLLVAKSVENKNKASMYFKSRCLRILPPLIFTVLITVIIMGIFFTKLDLFEYFTSSETYKYLLNAIMVPIHQLPKVFENNIYGPVINGALWTLPVEFICYIILFFVYKLKLMEKTIFKYTVLPILAVFIFLNTTSNALLITLSGYAEPVFMFYAGVAYYIYRDKIIFSSKLFIISSIIFVASIILGIAWLGLILFFPYLLIFLSFGIGQVNKWVDNLGAIAYGIYLCGFPIQQTIVYYFGGEMDPMLNFVIAVPVAILLGMIIYFVSEKKFNDIITNYKLKKYNL